MDLAPPLPEGLAGDNPVTVLWRPGCPYCAMLLRGLERTGLVFDRVDIWEHPEAAAWVRTVADGNETVPTVRIAAPGAESGTDALALVNPSPRAVLDAVARLVPDALRLVAELPDGLLPETESFELIIRVEGLSPLLRAQVEAILVRRRPEG
jgi:glutaredoxin